MKSLYAQYAISILYFGNLLLIPSQKKISETSRKPETMIIIYTYFKISTTCYHLESL